MKVRIKICGITTPNDAETAAALGVDWLGLNFYAKSPRYIDDATARSILEVVPPNVEPVALYVHERPEHAQRRSHALGIHTVQLHGDHREVLPAGTKWIAAFSILDNLQPITSYLDLLHASGATPYAILVDAHVPGMHGGTGRTAPWHLLADFRPGVPIILAGGLTPENVADAIRVVRPFAVDVASGVEKAPGKKDADKMRRFIDAVRSCD